MPTGERLKVFAKYATDKTCVLRSLKVSVLVGTVLALVNHYDQLLSGSISPTGLSQILVTYAVPYCVATFGAASQAAQMELEAHQGLKGPKTSEGPIKTTSYQFAGKPELVKSRKGVSPLNFTRF